MKTRTASVLCALVMALCPVPDLSAQESAPPVQQRAELWLDLYTGEPVEFAEMISDLAEADVVFLGEHHTIPRHHRWQKEIINALSTGEGSLVVGLEMMAKKFQPELDRYVRGEIDFDQLAEETEWGESWSNYEDYREVIESALKAETAIIALNVELALARKVGRQGVKALTEEERRALPRELDLNDGPYFDLLKMQMMVHPGITEDNLRNIYAAQVVRDETMAETMADYLKSPAGKGCAAVILCGAGHCSYGYGTVSRLKNRLPGAEDRILILSDSGDLELSPEMAKYARDIEISHQQMRDVVRQPLGDYLSIIQPKGIGSEN